MKKKNKEYVVLCGNPDIGFYIFKENITEKEAINICKEKNVNLKGVPIKSVNYYCQGHISELKNIKIIENLDLDLTNKVVNNGKEIEKFYMIHVKDIPTKEELIKYDESYDGIIMYIRSKVDEPIVIEIFKESFMNIVGVNNGK